MIVKPDFPDHWKTRLLVAELGGDEMAPIYLLRLWSHCELRRKWVFDELSSTALTSLCRYPGHANKLESALVASGWVRRHDSGTLTVSGWDEYNAALIAAWENGRKSGGRPKKIQAEKNLLPNGPETRRKKPTDNPPVTHGLRVGIPTGNPVETDRRGEEKKKEEEEESPKPIGLLLEPETLLAKWNACPWARPCASSFEIPNTRDLVARLADPAWIQNYERALAMERPKAFGPDGTMSIENFLKEETVPRLLSKFWDFDPKKPGKGGPKQKGAFDAFLEGS